MELVSILAISAVYLAAALVDAPKFREIARKVKTRAVYYVILAAGFLLSAWDLITHSRQ